MPTEETKQPDSKPELPQDYAKEVKMTAPTRVMEPDFGVSEAIDLDANFTMAPMVEDDDEMIDLDKPIYAGSGLLEQQQKQDD